MKVYFRLPFCFFVFFVCSMQLPAMQQDEGAIVPFFNDIELPLNGITHIVGYTVGMSIPVTFVDDEKEDENWEAILLKISQARHARLTCKQWNAIFACDKITQFTQDDSDGLLCYAVKTSRVATALMALKVGANVDVPINIKNQQIACLDGGTPIFYAAYNGDLEMVRFLLAQKASQKIVTKGMLTVRGLIKMLMLPQHVDEQVIAQYQPIYDLLCPTGALSSSSFSFSDDEVELV